MTGEAERGQPAVTTTTAARRVPDGPDRAHRDPDAGGSARDADAGAERGQPLRADAPMTERREEVAP